MIDQSEYACTVCGEDFILPERRAADPSRVLACPCCGSTDVLHITWEIELQDATAA